MFARAFPTSLRGAVAAAVKPNWIAVLAEQVYQKAISIDNRRYSAGPTSRPLRSAENRQLHKCMRASTHCGHRAFRTAGPRRMSTWRSRCAKPVASTRHATQRSTGLAWQRTVATRSCLVLAKRESDRSRAREEGGYPPPSFVSLLGSAQHWTACAVFCRLPLPRLCPAAARATIESVAYAGAPLRRPSRTTARRSRSTRSMPMRTSTSALSSSANRTAACAVGGHR